MKCSGPQEICDIYNEAGEPIGRATRGEAHQNPSLVHRAVHVLVFNRGGQLLLQKRVQAKDIEPGKWDTSVGGHLDPGEDWITTARSHQVSLILMTYVGVPPVTFETVNDVLRQAARSCSMPLVNNDQILHPLLVDQAGLVNTDLRNALFFPDMHPTAQGYQRIADNLARFLIEQHLLPRAEARNDKP